ncbi:MAG: mevalonate kinase [Candidatus Altiarchaeota archaeon]|nr:mevalonate kinase [Candidatus Altiarchaeota archaeon]
MVVCGYGKVILFGEHFVVYGLPAIASALELRVTAEVIPAEHGIAADDLLSGKKVFLGRDSAPIIDLMPFFLKKFNVPKDRHFYLKLASDVPRHGGLGSSAALVVAVTRAMNEYFKSGFSDEQVNKVAFEAEKYFHMTPSGVDNTAATYGGMVWFQKQPDNRVTMERIKLSQPVEIVIGDTGVSRDTGNVVQGLRERKENNPEKYHQIFAEAESLVHEAKQALLGCDLPLVGELMNRNHKLLQDMEVSSYELDSLCKVALRSWALGAKLTGAGKGGCMLALTPGRNLQERVANAFTDEGYTAIKTSIG